MQSQAVRRQHYGPEHLQTLLRVKSLQEAGRSLDEIRAILHRKPARAAAAAEAAVESTLERSVWRRLAIAPGVEIHVSSALRLPPPAKLGELASWCRIYESPSHSILVAFEEMGASVTLSQKEAPLDRDFVLSLETSSFARPTAWIERDEDGEIRRILPQPGDRQRRCPPARLAEQEVVSSSSRVVSWAVSRAES